MVERIGRDSALSREAVQAAIKQAAERIASAPPASVPFPSVLGAAPRVEVGAAAAPQGGELSGALEGSLRGIDRDVQATESLPLDILTGKVDDFHQIAVQLKSAELSFKFAMEIRNKLVDAYREIMRMGV